MSTVVPHDPKMTEGGFTVTRQDILNRIRAEYVEMPGLTMTAPQLERLCGVEAALCQTVLDSLVAMKVLRVNEKGAYTRRGERRHSEF